MPQNAFFLQTHNLLVSQKMMQRHFFPTLHPLSTVIFATATVLAFVLLRNSRFSFHCYTQCEATPTQKLARKCTATSHDILRKRLQNAFTLANQLRWIAQYNADCCKRSHFGVILTATPQYSYTMLFCNTHSSFWWVLFSLFLCVCCCCVLCNTQAPAFILRFPGHSQIHTQFLCWV